MGNRMWTKVWTNGLFNILNVLQVFGVTGMAGVAQLVELWIVIPVVEGSSPFARPSFFFYQQNPTFFFLSAGVVQLDRAADFESECWEFESLRPHQSHQRITQI